MSEPRDITPEELERMRRITDRAWFHFLGRQRRRDAVKDWTRRTTSYSGPEGKITGKWNLRRIIDSHLGRAWQEYDYREVFPDGIFPTAQEFEYLSDSGVNGLPRRLFFRIYVGRVAIQSDEVQTAIRGALASSDSDFFNAFAAVIQIQKSDGRWWEKAADRLQLLLLERWDVATNHAGVKIPELFYFGSKGLAAIARVVKDRDVNEETVKMARYRLGLKPFPRRKRIAKLDGQKLVVKMLR